MEDLTSSTKSITENDKNSNHVDAPNNLNFSSLIGNTPLVRLGKLLQPHDYSCQIFAKCEFKNPTGSPWDRYVAAKIQEINQSDDSYNATHFATGGNCDLCLSLAWAGAAGDFRVTVLPGPGYKVDSNKITLLKSYGANVALSLRDAPLHKQTQGNLNALIQQLEDTSGILHHRITGTASDASKFYYETIPTEMFRQMDEFGNVNDFDIIVCSGENKGLIQGVAKRFFESSGKSPSVYGVDLTGNSFWDKMVDDSNENTESKTETSKLIKWMQVSDAESYDVARRLMREEGLTVGPVSGAVVSLALRLIEDQGLGNNPDAKILVLLTDSLMNSGQEFLSTEWMVEKGYYDVQHLDSLFWWYDMAIENICPPDFMVVPPNVTVECVLGAMIDTKTERVVVATRDRDVIGVVTYADLFSNDIQCPSDDLIKDHCTTQVGLIESTVNFSALEALLSQFNWVVNIHTITEIVHCDSETKSKSMTKSKDIVGVINTADFMKYKRKIEGHHLKEYKLAMSDGIPSKVWLDIFKEKRLN